MEDEKQILFNKIFMYRLFLLLTIASFLLSGFLLKVYLGDRSRIEAMSHEAARAQVRAAALEINKKKRRLMEKGIILGDQIDKNKIDAEAMNGLLRQTLVNTPSLHGIGVAYTPYAFSPELELFSSAFERDGKHLKPVTQKEDYTESRFTWFHSPIANNRPLWVEPHFDAKGKHLVRFCVPLYRAGDKKKPDGILYLLYPVDRVSGYKAYFNLGKTGYAYILSKKGTYIVHPTEELVRTERSYFQRINEETRDEDMRILGIKAISPSSAHEVASIDHIDDVTGQSSWVFYQNLESTGWALIAVHLKEKQSHQELRRERIRICLSLLLFLSFLFVLVFRGYDRERARLWMLSTSISLLLIAVIGLVWVFSIDDPPVEPKKSVTIVDRVALDAFKKERTVLAGRLRSKPPIFVPVGLFVQSIAFTGANDVLLTGYMWARFPKKENFDRTIIFPEKADGDVDEVSKREEGDEEVVTWNFKVTLREQFEYSQYPFDKENVWIRLWPGAFDKNVVLVPDLSSYTLTNPVSLPGLGKDTFLSGWTLEQSYFDYKYNSYNTNVAGVDRTNQSETPELYFNIIARRNFLGPFISEVIPLLVVICIIFGMLLQGSRRGDGPNFTVLEILGGASALIFTIIIAHIDLRKTVVADEILYVEYFYFTTYLIILGVSVNSFLFARNNSALFIRYRDNLIPKLLFWPISLLTILIVTLAIFY